MLKRLSPWGLVDRQEITKKGRTQVAFDLKGISQLDYLDLFQSLDIVMVHKNRTNLTILPMLF